MEGAAVMKHPMKSNQPSMGHVAHENGLLAIFPARVLGRPRAPQVIWKALWHPLRPRRPPP
eukprot:3438186-Pyramimonas_sp.AAC.1